MDGEPENMCRICMIELNDEEPYSVLCKGDGWKHIYHDKCINAWFETAISKKGGIFRCPTCSRDIQDLVNIEQVQALPLIAWPNVVLTINATSAIITGEILRKIYLAHMDMFAYRRAFPDGVPDGEAVPAGWAEMVVRPDWRNTYIFSATLAMTIIFNYVVMYLRRKSKMSRTAKIKPGLRGGSNDNTLCINDSCYPIDPELVTILTEALLNIKLMVEKEDSPTNISNSIHYNQKKHLRTTRRYRTTRRNRNRNRTTLRNALAY